MDDLARRALAVNQAMLALGNEVFQADGATFVRNGELPSERDGNFVADVAAATPAEIERLLARVEREFAGVPYRRFEVDFTTPPAFEARLVLDGYQRDEALLLVLEGALAGEPRPYEIRPVVDESGWQARAELVAESWREYEQRAGRAEDLAAALRAGRAKSPPMRYWLACVDGRPRAYGASWSGIDGVGQVEYLFTHPEFRGRGLATALIHRGVADCRERGAGPVVITAGAWDTPKQMYAALGFRPVAVKRSYWKAVGAERPS